MNKSKALQLGFIAITTTYLSAPVVEAAPASTKSKPATKSTAKATASKTTRPKVAAPKVTPSQPAALPLPPAPVAQVPVAPAAPVQATLPAGTKLQLLLADELISNKAKVGEEVVYFVREDVLSPDGKVFIKKGARASGKITAAKGAKSFGRKGKLEFTVEEVEAIDGTKVLLRSNNEKNGKGRGATMVAVTALVTVFGVFIKGKNVTVPKDTLIEAYVDNDTSVMPAPQVAGAAPAPQAAVTPPEPVMGTITMQTKPSGSK